MHKPARLTQLPTSYCLCSPPWAPTVLEKTSPQPRWKQSWWQMRSWDRKCKGNARASASSFELWRYLVSISGTIYLTCICDLVFVCFSSLSITLAVKVSVSGRFTIRGNTSTPKKKNLKPCIFLHWGQYSCHPPLSLLTEMREKERQRSNCLPSIRSTVNLSQQRAKVTAFKKNFVAFRMQAEVLHLCSDDKTCPQAAGALQFTLGELRILKWSGFILI